MMPQSARILTTACSKPAVPAEDWQREYGTVTCSASPQRSRYTEPLLFPPSCMVQRPGFLCRKQIRLFEWFHHCRLHSILGNKWQDYVSNEEVLKRASLRSVESILLQVQLCWAGHITRMEDICLPQSSLLQGAPRKRYKDQQKRWLAQAEISYQPWQQEASDPDNWCSSMGKASRKFEAERHEATKERRRRQKEQAASQSSLAQPFICPKCSRVCT